MISAAQKMAQSVKLDGQYRLASRDRPSGVMMTALVSVTEEERTK